MNEDVAIQDICPKCLMTQPPEHIMPFSEGVVPCEYCDKYTRVLSVLEYKETMQR